MAAVFGGAARVPIATLLMVTEMTGGYHLLVPAALAVMLCYLVQVALSASLAYRSLYEAQVPSRADSPAHHVEHLRIALGLLRKRLVSIPATIAHLDLLELLTSGIPVDLPDGKQLTIGMLRAESSCVGQPIQSGCLGKTDEEEIVAVLRQGRMLLPHPDTVLRAEDQLLVIASPQTWARWLVEHLAPIPS
jgi:CIC family chloride channel protein